MATSTSQSSDFTELVLVILKFLQKLEIALTIITDT